MLKLSGQSMMLMTRKTGGRPGLSRLKEGRDQNGAAREGEATLDSTQDSTASAAPSSDAKLAVSSTLPCVEALESRTTSWSDPDPAWDHA